MSLILADRVRETSSTVGTGSISLDGAVTGYQSFSSAIGNANTCYYTIYNAGLNEWEVGIGTYTASGNLLARTTVLSSSNSNSLVSFTAGLKDVFVTYPAEKAVYLNASGDASSLGTPAVFNAANVVGLPISTGVSGLGSGVATALSYAIGAAGSPVIVGGALGTPSSGDLSNCTLPAPTSVILPNKGGTGIANNNASTLTISGAYAITVTVTGVTGVTLPTSGTLATLAGSETFTNKTLTSPTVTNYTESTVAIGSSGTSKTLDLTNGTVQTITMTGNCTFTMPAVGAGKSFILIVNSGAGSFTGTFTSVKWPSNTAPTLTTTASRWDILSFQSDGTYWYGAYQQAYQ